MKKKIVFILIVLFFASTIDAQQNIAVQMSETAMRIWPDSFLIGKDKTAKWRYDQGVILKGIESLWKVSAAGNYFNYLQKSIDFFVDQNGNIKTYKADEYNLDHLNNGKLILSLYEVAGKEKYKKAAQQLRNQIKSHPRNQFGGLWHKKIYPNQMWLDGLYMAQPFLAQYAVLMSDTALFSDIAHQFTLMYQHAFDSQTGLLFHGWDASKEQLWANPVTGQSPNFWLRSIGWYAMALVDVLDYFPKVHQQYASLINILNRLTEAIVQYQDPNSGVWYNIPNLPNQKNNYLEASGSCMLTYTLAKAIRQRLISSQYLSAVKKAWNGIQQHFIIRNQNGTTLSKTVAVSGLGGNPYRDGSISYYLNEPVVDNDPKGIGAAILCAVEMEYYFPNLSAKPKKILLDYYFNKEFKKNDSSNQQWHYIWEDRSNGGFSFLQTCFEKFGAITSSLKAEPTLKNLKAASVYIIVDPDNEKESASPNFIQSKHIYSIARWVKSGGVLVLMANDSGNVELKHFNQLTEKFGFRFKENSINRVQNNFYEQGTIITPINDLFSAQLKLFIKEIATIETLKPIDVLLKHQNENIIVATKYGKGHVLAIGDPWLYNEYVDGRKLPISFQNYLAAEAWVKWILKNAHE